jgi:hypothetical protein
MWLGYVGSAAKKTTRQLEQWMRVIWDWSLQSSYVLYQIPIATLRRKALISSEMFLVD